MFTKLSSISNPTQISEADVQDLEQFVVSLYSRTVNDNKVNTARRILFAQDSRTVENILPTSDALKQYVERSALQAIMWRQFEKIATPAMDPLQWGWQKTELSYSPVGTTLPEASKACRIAYLLNVGARSLAQRVANALEMNLIVQSYVHAWETAPMDNKCGNKNGLTQELLSYEKPKFYNLNSAPNIGLITKAYQKLRMSRETLTSKS